MMRTCVCACVHLCALQGGVLSSTGTPSTGCGRSPCLFPPTEGTPAHGYPHCGRHADSTAAALDERVGASIIGVGVAKLFFGRFFRVASRQTARVVAATRQPLRSFVRAASVCSFLHADAGSSVNLAIAVELRLPCGGLFVHIALVGSTTTGTGVDISHFVVSVVVKVVIRRVRRVGVLGCTGPGVCDLHLAVRLVRSVPCGRACCTPRNLGGVGNGVVGIVGVVGRFGPLQKDERTHPSKKTDVANCNANDDADASACAGAAVRGWRVGSDHIISTDSGTAAVAEHRAVGRDILLPKHTCTARRVA